MHRNAYSLAAASLAVALSLSSPARADATAPVTPLMERAFAKLEQGPDHLRWFAYRTQIIYGLSAADIIAAYEAKKLADARTPGDTTLASTDVPAKR